MSEHKSVASQAEGMGADIHHTVQGLMRDAKPLLQHAKDQVSDQVSELAQKGLDAACNSKHDIEKSGRHLVGHAASLIRDEPFKAMLIAAGMGAAVVAVLGLMSHRSTHSH
jgi:ElaB/YqjD/DUF883 family membrane-anchored ribosome-binding protein